jgi:hypothetical protein
MSSVDEQLYRYEPRTLIADYLRAGVGAFLCLAPLLVVEAGTIMVYILAALGALFLVFGIRTLLRHRSAVALSAEGLRIHGPWPRSLAWRDLSVMKLAYFSTGRTKARGWMELKLRGGGTGMAFDSSLEGFDAIVAAALHAARANDLALSEVTLANLDAMGFAVSPDAMPDDHL